MDSFKYPVNSLAAIAPDTREYPLSDFWFSPAESVVMPTLKHSGWNAYGVAVLSVAGSVILTFALIPLVHQRVPLLPFVAAGLVSPWDRGLEPGVGAPLLGA